VSENRDKRKCSKPFNLRPFSSSKKHRSSYELNGLMIDDGKILRPKKWRFDPHCQSFVKLAYDPLLAFPEKSNIKRVSAAKVFCELPFDMKHFGGNLRHDGYKFLETFKIEETMGYQPGPWDSVLSENRRLIFELDYAVYESTLKSRYKFAGGKQKMDHLAYAFMDLCGLNEFPVRIRCPLESSYQLFGQETECIRCHRVVCTPQNDLVLIFGDQSMTHKEVVQRQGHVGEMTCKLLQLLSLNYCKNPRVIRDVFAVRFVTHHVTFFRIKPIATTLDTLINTTDDPSTKLTLLCSDPDPFNNQGLSLVDPTQRKQAVQLATKIRHSLRAGYHEK
jgi:hypothetical protein